MLTSRYKLLGSQLVTRHWAWVIGTWLVLAVLLRMFAPAWDEIAADGDLAFLPETVPSAVGQQALESAFPGSQSRSQMVLVFATTQAELGVGDLALAFDVARRLHWLAALNAWQTLHATEQANLATVVAPAASATETVAIKDTVLAEVARDNLTEAIEIEEVLLKYIQAQDSQATFLRLPNAYQMRGELLILLGEDEEQAALDLDLAKLMREQGTPTLPSEAPEWSRHVLDVWSWRNAIVGHKLGSNQPHARLINVQLGTDFTAVSNIGTIGGIEQLIRDLRPDYQQLTSADLRIEISGSAAVGADMLRAAASGVRKTEIVTIVLVLLILAAVYRSPFLVAIPLTSIAISLVVATGLIALLARDPLEPDGPGLGVFTTTRIFVVVLLFGAGTDFCLFFLARNREMLAMRSVTSRQQMYRVVAKSWRSVHDALLASAMTTIVGLALMWFSHFEKFQFSGPIIAISLAVTLVVCLTFTPALLSGLGRIAFWPQLPSRSLPASGRVRRGNLYWGRLATAVVHHSGWALLATLLFLCVPAFYGFIHLNSVTYDLTEELSESAPSRRGAQLISRYFPTQDGSPVTVLMTRKQPFDSEDTLREASSQLSQALYLEGVESVRSLSDPLGDYPPGKRMGLFDKAAWRRRLLNRITREHYISSVSELQRRVARFDLVLKDNPFSLDASQTLALVKHQLEETVADPASPWSNAEIATTGTTVGISDLRMVTQSDQRRIQILVTVGVWLVLVSLLRQWVLSTYLIFTVLLSYFATLGITFWTFSTLYGASYSGLDWKVPLFLFVILVAVGQDYNVYLVTRIFEERRSLGLVAGVRRALEVTGGIITSCGFVMAGTFIAMTSPAVLLWLAGILPVGWIDTQAPVLRGITELGFALACGVLLDTLVVRSILVPSFIVLWQPWQSTPVQNGPAVAGDADQLPKK